MNPLHLIYTFDKAVGGPEAFGNGSDATTDEGHFEMVVVAHEHRRPLAAAEDANIARMTANEDRHGHRVDVVTFFTAQTTTLTMHSVRKLYTELKYIRKDVRIF